MFSLSSKRSRKKRVPFFSFLIPLGASEGRNSTIVRDERAVDAARLGEGNDVISPPQSGVMHRDSACCAKVLVRFLKTIVTAYQLGAELSSTQG